MTDLYIAARSDDASILKVGRSDCAQRRCADLSKGHAFRLRVVAIWPCRGLLEGAVHRALEAQRVPGGGGREWFRCSQADVYAAMGEVLQRERARDRAAAWQCLAALD